MEANPEKLLKQLMAEAEGLIPRGFAQKVESDITGSGNLAITRRLALAYLEKPFGDVAGQVGADREFAVSLAHICDALDAHLGSYEALLGWLRAATTRMSMSIAMREDMESVFAEAKERSRSAEACGRFLSRLQP